MLVVDGLTKRYASFSLHDVSFNVPAGHITGFIGVNGAGKTTTLKSIMNIVRPDAGRVTLDGQDLLADDTTSRRRIGYMLGPVETYPKHPVRTVVEVARRFHPGWDDDVFTGLLTRFRIDDRKKINELSTGMRVKLGIAMALSHGARLIVLDEPTSGLDPVARDELLELFQEVVADGERGVLLSTHITDDLDRSADHLAFIRNGRIVAHDTKDDLISDHVLVRGGADDLTDDLRQQMIGHKRNAFGFTGLAHTAELTPSDTLHTERPDLASLMRYYELQEAS